MAILLALSDTVGVTGIIEGIRGKELLTDRPLSAADRTERGVLGAVTLISLVIGARSAIKGPPGGAYTRPVELPPRHPRRSDSNSHRTSNGSHRTSSNNRHSRLTRGIARAPAPMPNSNWTHTVERHGPGVPLRRGAAGVRTVEGRIHGILRDLPAE